MSNSSAILAKLAFNGFHVTYYDHEERIVRTQSFPTVDTVLARKFTLDEFPSAEDFAEDLFNVFGDVVGMVKDNNEVVLLDNMEGMNDFYERFGNWP